MRLVFYHCATITRLKKRTLKSFLFYFFVLIEEENQTGDFKLIGPCKRPYSSANILRIWSLRITIKNETLSISYNQYKTLSITVFSATSLSIKCQNAEEARHFPQKYSMFESGNHRKEWQNASVNALSIYG
jgi:hypothetical protein